MPPAEYSQSFMLSVRLPTVSVKVSLKCGSRSAIVALLYQARKAATGREEPGPSILFFQSRWRAPTTMAFVMGFVKLPKKYAGSDVLVASLQAHSDTSSAAVSPWMYTPMVMVTESFRVAASPAPAAVRIRRRSVSVSVSGRVATRTAHTMARTTTATTRSTIMPGPRVCSVAFFLFIGSPFMCGVPHVLVRGGGVLRSVPDQPGADKSLRSHGLRSLQRVRLREVDGVVRRRQVRVGAGAVHAYLLGMRTGVARPSARPRPGVLVVAASAVPRMAVVDPECVVAGLDVDEGTQLGPGYARGALTRGAGRFDFD